MDLFLQHIRGTNVYRVDMWEDDYLRHTNFRIEDFGRIGWLIRGCPTLERKAFESRIIALETLRDVISMAGLDRAHREVVKYNE